MTQPQTPPAPITPVILTGGSGTRLWPASRKAFPKQFVALTGQESLFQATLRRLSGPGFGAPLILTHGDFRFIVSDQMAATGIVPRDILIEPEPRNTAPAVLAAAMAVAADDPQGLVLIAPSDHLIRDAAGFTATIRAGIPAAQDGRIVTFGITPDRAETGYGYLQPAGPGIAPLHRFVEKPDAAHAAQMLNDGGFLWNAGIFLFRADVMIDAFASHAPDYPERVQAALDYAQRDLNFLRLAPQPWVGLPDLSIDYAVMEQAGNLTVVPYDGDWNDLGGWDAIWREGLAQTPDPRGVVAGPHSTALDCDNTLLRSDDPDTEIVGIGLRDLVVVASGDAVLVADKSRAQQVRTAVATLKARGARQAERFARDHRPWGWFETLAISDRFQVKRIVVKPGGILSLQSHMHRSEHWIVVSGTARVTLNDDVMLVTENQSIYIPLGARHRLENPGKLPMVLIEVQTGAYLAEDDITRFEDLYARD